MTRFALIAIAALIAAPSVLFAEEAAKCCAAPAAGCESKASPACETKSASACTTATNACPAMGTTLPDGSKCERCFTKEELAKFNGKNGQPPYIAVDGVVYDVTGVSSWKYGSHEGYDAAGTDVTKNINTKSPHGTKVLKKLKCVGRLVKEAPAK